MNLMQLQREIEELNRSKGWYEGVDPNDPDTHDAKEALIHSELAEATECVRNGDLLPRFREDGKPEGLPSELADVIIRTLDAMNLRGVAVFETPRTEYSGPDLTPTQLLKGINRIHRRVVFSGAHQEVIRETYAFAARCKIDLNAALEVKHAYNATRPHRHGGKAL